MRELKKCDVEESTGSMDGGMENIVKDTQTAKSARKNRNSGKRFFNKVVSSLRQNIESAGTSFGLSNFNLTRREGNNPRASCNRMSLVSCVLL